MILLLHSSAQPPSFPRVLSLPPGATVFAETIALRRLQDKPAECAVFVHYHGVTPLHEGALTPEEAGLLIRRIAGSWTTYAPVHDACYFDVDSHIGLIRAQIKGRLPVPAVAFDIDNAHAGYLWQGENPWRQAWREWMPEGRPFNYLPGYMVVEITGNWDEDGEVLERIVYGLRKQDPQDTQKGDTA